MQTATDFRFNVFDMMSSLVYSRAVHPCSKSRTYDEVLPKLFDDTTFSLSQLYSGLEYIGMEYEKIIEIYNHQINKKFKFDTSHTLTVQTFILKSTVRMSSGKKVLPRKTVTNRLSDSDFFWMQTRFP
mgnify:CR=1 FL=1